MLRTLSFLVGAAEAEAEEEAAASFILFLLFFSVVGRASMMVLLGSLLDPLMDFTPTEEDWGMMRCENAYGLIKVCRIVNDE
jgi:hypothetical protein